jgi:hypothetical protein
MGMFDTVMVRCPRCGEKSEFQSKSGKCLLNVYELDDCPKDVLADVNRHAPNICEYCETVFAVDLSSMRAVTYNAIYTPKVERPSTISVPSGA